MNSLANTTWTLEQDGAGSYSATVSFGANSAPTGASGGNGTYTDTSGSTPIVWVENGHEFMFQQTNQDPGYATLTTYTGTHRSGAGSGWLSNFLVNFCNTGFSITKNK